MTRSLDRRAFLVTTGASALLVACGGNDDAGTVASASPTSTTSTPTSATPTSSPTSTSPVGSGAPLVALTAADFDPLGSCLMSPEKTAGPFPLDEQFDRRDVTEGKPGHPLRLGLRVVDATCAPVAGATVEIWHADATGDYSAFRDNGGGKDEGPGTTFLRGSQTAGADGIVEFQTIYPGWYRGRAVHIHVRVHREGRPVLTSQLFFDDAYTATVYSADPYAEFGTPDTPTASDGIAGDARSEGTVLTTTAAETSLGSGSIGLHNLAVAV